MKRIFAILLLSLLLLCGVGAAAETTFSVEVFDFTNANSPMEGVQVIISKDSSNIGNLFTTSNGAAEFKNIQFPETYTITVSKSGYITQTKSVKVSVENQKSPFYLVQDTPILITVTSSEGGIVPAAEVSINGKAAGKTDETGRLHASMIRGSYNTIEVSAPSYEPYVQTLILEESTTSIPVTLTLSKVSPLILVYSEDMKPINGASVSINGKVVKYTDPYGRAELPSYTAGVYDVKVEANGFGIYTGSIEFSDDSVSHTVTLKYATATVTIKTMAGNEPVPETVIYIDGDNRGITDANGIYTTSAAPDTKLYISASHEGYTAESTTYTVKAGSDNTVIITMEEDIPYILIGIGILSIIIIILILVLIIGGRKKGKKSERSPAKSYPPTNKRNSL